MSWRVAFSLDTLLQEVNSYAPDRNDDSDGTIGNQEHAERDSRHNPNDEDVVTARDITYDALKFDVHTYVRRLAARPDLIPIDLYYMISDGDSFSRENDFKPRPYKGKNPHKVEAHFGVGRGPDGDPVGPYDNKPRWFVRELMTGEVNDMFEKGDREALIETRDNNRKIVGLLTDVKNLLTDIKNDLKDK
jgi:hypothetical protein